MDLRAWIDVYILDVLMLDLTGHDKRPSAFLVYLLVWRRTAAEGSKLVPLSYQEMAEATGLSKSAVQAAVAHLKKRRLLTVKKENPTAIPLYRVETPWIRKGPK
jgi:CRP-like cAMP-binding protein